MSEHGIIENYNSYEKVCSDKKHLLLCNIWFQKYTSRKPISPWFKVWLQSNSSETWHGRLAINLIVTLCIKRKVLSPENDAQTYLKKDSGDLEIKLLHKVKANLFWSKLYLNVHHFHENNLFFPFIWVLISQSKLMININFNINFL